MTHFHYTEWPESDTVPTSTHGLLGLVEHALAHQDQASLTGPIAVHCRYDYIFWLSLLFIYSLYTSYEVPLGALYLKRKKGVEKWLKPTQRHKSINL